MAKSDPQMRSLFDAVEPSPRVDTSRPATSSQLARNFVRWCCSFGKEFRNSPDAVNLRAWAEKEGFPYKSTHEKQILKSAQKLYFKRVMSLLRKSRGTDGSSERPLVN